MTRTTETNPALVLMESIREKYRSPTLLGLMCMASIDTAQVIAHIMEARPDVAERVEKERQKIRYPPKNSA